MDLGKARPRVNGSLLPSCQGQGVTLLGMASNPGNDGKSFQLTTSDQVKVTVLLEDMLQEYIEGLVEVHGVVNGRNDIVCHSYVLFPPETAKNFDMAIYDKAVTLMNQHPQHYMNGAP